MQPTIYTTNNSRKSISKLTHFSIVALLFLGGMFTNNNLNGQIVMEFEDIVMFSGPANNFHGFNQPKEPNIQVSPNPINNHVKISKEQGVNITKLDIYDMQGNKHFSSSQSSGFVYIPQLEAGLYNFIVHTDKGPTSKLMSIN